jgi:hypothetical protein
LSHAPSPFCVGHLFIFGDTGPWTRGLKLARQVVYHLSHSSRPFFVIFFSR